MTSLRSGVKLGLMKKLLIILVSCLLLCGVTYAEESKPKYDAYSLNKNIIEHGWKVKSKRITSEKDIYTLTKGKWILVCQIVYKTNRTDTDCILP